MREILFRGKRIDNGEWVKGYYAGYGLICPNEPESTYNATGDYYGQTPYVGFVEVDPDTVGQYTGLKDKNGKRIFEGDIVCMCFVDTDEIGEIVWDEEWSKTAYLSQDGDKYGIDGTVEMEIIGNIHDNGELLLLCNEIL